MTPPFSDYIVYVDESGDHSLESINPEYPLFVLSFCIFRKDAYANTMTPAVRRLKFETFGHDMVVLHEIDIRKKKGAFAKLGKEAREAFLTRLTDIIQAEDFRLVAVVIDKGKLKTRYANPGHPYHLAMEFGLERIHRYLQSMGRITGSRIWFAKRAARRRMPNWNSNFAGFGTATIISTSLCPSS